MFLPDVSFDALDNPEEGQRERTLSGACSANNTDLLLRLDIETNILEHKVKPRAIAGAVVIELHGTLSRPADGRATFEDHVGCLTREISVLENSLN